MKSSVDILVPTLKFSWVYIGTIVTYTHGPHWFLREVIPGKGDHECGGVFGVAVATFP